MKRIPLVFFVFSLLGSWTLGAQTPPEVVFSVTSGGEPLPYAYVFLKNAIYGSTDSLGRAAIPASELTPGDTLMFSYVGSLPVRVAYDGKKAYSVEIDPVEIEAVSVTARRKVKLGKDIKPVQNVNWFEEFRGDVQMALHPGSDTVRSYEGRFMLVYIPAENYLERLTSIWEFTPEVGSETLESYFKTILGRAVILIHLWPQSRMNQESRLSYDGLTKDSLAMYTLVRRFARNTANYQLRLYVDPVTKIVRRLTLYEVRPSSLILQMNADYALSENQRRLYPSRVEMLVTDPAGKEVLRGRVSNTTLSEPLKKYYEVRKKLLKEKKNEEQ